MASRTMGKRGGFPWGLALLAVGGYLLYERSKGQNVIPQTNNDAGSDVRNYVLTWANTQFGQTSAQAQWAQTVPDDDVQRMYNVLQVWNYTKPDGTKYGYCPSSGPGTYPQCYQDWQALKTKYPSVLGVINY